MNIKVMFSAVIMLPFLTQCSEFSMKNAQIPDPVFPLGEKVPNDFFIGEVYLSMLTDSSTPYECPIGNVTFEPGARNHWHRHSGGQILLVTAGEGFYQERNNPLKRIRKGDVVTIAPGVEHWHGATPETGMTHLSITPNSKTNQVTWLEPVPVIER